MWYSFVLQAHFILPKDDSLLWEYITRIRNNHYKDWKSDWYKHYLRHGEKVPKKFTHCKEEWSWLIKHFKEPAEQTNSKRLKEVREKRRITTPDDSIHHLSNRPPTEGKQSTLYCYI